MKKMYKMLSIFISIALIFSAVGLVSAGDGSSKENAAEVLYVASPGFITFPFGQDGGGSVPKQGLNEANNLWYNITFVPGYTSDWTAPHPDYLKLADNDKFKNYDIVFIDMVHFYLGNFTTSFENASKDENGTVLVSILSGPGDGTSPFSEVFDYLDTYDITANKSWTFKTEEWPGNEACIEFVGDSETNPSFEFLYNHEGPKDKALCDDVMEILINYSNKKPSTDPEIYNKHYTVDYYLGTGFESIDIPEEEYLNGKSFKLSELPRGVSKQGYEFGGWTLSDSNTSDKQTIYKPGDEFFMIPENVVFNAVWNPLSYNVIFDLNGGSGEAPVRNPTAVGFTFIVPDIPKGVSKDGFEFAGWRDSASGKHYNVSDRYTMGAADAVLKAEWKAVESTEKTYRFFLQNGDFAQWISGNGTNPVTAIRNACEKNSIEIDISENGWVTTIDNVGSVEYPEGSGTWYYWILFERIDNNWVYSSKTIDGLHDDDYFAFVYGTTGGMTYESLTTPDKPVKGNFELEGYYTDENLENRYDFSVMPTEDIKLYINWQMPRDFKYPILVPEDGKEKHDLKDVIVLLQYTAGVGLKASVSQEEMIENGFDLNSDNKIDLFDVIIYLKGL